MSQAPSMPMFWDAYLADTTHLTTEEHGAYLLLLAAMWRRNGSVPDDDRDNARIVGMTPAKWRRMKVRLDSLLIIDDGEITQKNLQKTWKNTQEKIRKNRANGARGGRPKSNKTKDMGKANGLFWDNPNETIPEPEPYILDSLVPSLEGSRDHDETQTKNEPLDTGNGEGDASAGPDASAAASTGGGIIGGGCRQNGSVTIQPASTPEDHGSLPVCWRVGS